MTQQITVQDLERLIDSDPRLTLVDVRSADEYAAGHVPQAMNIPLEEADARINDLGSGPVALLCQSGNRAGMACELLREHHPNLLVVEGGTDAWVQAGKPVVASTAARWSLERQVRFGAGLMVLAGTLLSLLHHPAWISLAIFVGAGLTFAGLTNICGMAFLLAKLPWNRQASPKLKQQVTA
ncbi:MAG: Inner membrane protein YgaP [Fimbriimonadaceae bacterium]|nr:Inner membrane protein YgaP [Fimbriimonadaceae bacterium]